MFSHDSCKRKKVHAMTKTTLGELLKRQILKAGVAKIKNEDQEALNTSLSNLLVRGTDKPTTVDKGGWLKLFRQAHPSPSAPA